MKKIKIHKYMTDRNMKYAMYAMLALAAVSLVLCATSWMVLYLAAAYVVSYAKRYIGVQADGLAKEFDEKHGAELRANGISRIASVGRCCGHAVAPCGSEGLKVSVDRLFYFVTGKLGSAPVILDKQTAPRLTIIVDGSGTTILAPSSMTKRFNKDDVESFLDDLVAASIEAYTLRVTNEEAIVSSWSTPVPSVVEPDPVVSEESGVEASQSSNEEAKVDAVDETSADEQQEVVESDVIEDKK